MRKEKIQVTSFLNHGLTFFEFPPVVTLINQIKSLNVKVIVYSLSFKLIYLETKCLLFLLIPYLQ